MGADLILSTLWTDGRELDSNLAKKLVREALLNEQDETNLVRAASFTGTPLDELSAAVVAADPEAQASWRGKLADAYDKTIDEFISSLSNRDVTTVRIGPLLGYATGGMSWGDDPSDTYTEWERFFADGDSPWNTDDEDEPSGNPYGGLIFRTLFLSWNGDYALPGDRYVAGVTFETKTAEAAESVR